MTCVALQSLDVDVAEEFGCLIATNERLERVWYSRGRTMEYGSGGMCGRTVFSSSCGRVRWRGVRGVIHVGRWLAVAGRGL